MSTRVVDRYGRPFPTEEVRPRMGFLGGDALPTDGEPCTFSQPSNAEVPMLRDTSDGDNDPMIARRR